MPNHFYLFHVYVKRKAGFGSFAKLTTISSDIPTAKPAINFFFGSIELGIDVLIPLPKPSKCYHMMISRLIVSHKTKKNT